MKASIILSIKHCQKVGENAEQLKWICSHIALLSHSHISTKDAGTAIGTLYTQLKLKLRFVLSSRSSFLEIFLICAHA